MEKSTALQPNVFRRDFVSSIIVFLVAIPLCLGIALATGAPIFSGLLTGIIGGIVVGIISESQVSVSGPAAGMIAVVIAAISQLGSFEAFLLALFLAGLFQIAIGVLRAGFIADYVPSNVIQGLLTAIGILIIIKQLPLAFGYFPEKETLQASLKVAQQTLSLAPLLHLLTHINLGSTIITIISLSIIPLWKKIPSASLTKVPAEIVVVVAAVLLSKLFNSSFPSLALNKINLINFPTIDRFSSILSNFIHPNFQDWKVANIYIYALMIAIVASLETLLNLEAAEKLDKSHHYCSRNRELVAQGVGNTLSGLLGGLPVTSVIIRTSVNINAGARSKLSTIFHGILLLISLVFLSKLMNRIPISSLAAILIFTGYKLSNWSIFKKMYSRGFTYFFPFIITVLAIVFTNLLLGIIVGLIVSATFILKKNSKSFFTRIHETHPSGEIIRLVLPQQVTFLNKAAIIAGLDKLPRDSKVIIDAHHTEYIDLDILTLINEFKGSQIIKKNILLNLEGFQKHYKFKDQISFINVTTFDVQGTLTPHKIYKILKEGNQRFVNNVPIHKSYKQQIKVTSKSQHPIAVILSCIDSRVPIEIIFDMTLGDVFVVRVAGNVSNSDILASIEFACKIAGTKLIMVLGHTHCGAITAACDGVKLGHVTKLIAKIQPAIKDAIEKNKDLKINSPEFLNNVARNNVELTKKHIYKDSKILRELIDNKEIGIVGALYDVATGEVEFGTMPEQ